LSGASIKTPNVRFNEEQANLTGQKGRIMKGNRVVVTGMGAVTPLGLDVDSSWAGICDGRSGAAAIERFDAAAFSTCCLQKNFAAEQNTVMLTFKCHNIAAENRVSP